MLPMCYPSDHNDRTFIPNWAMWYGVEMGEYLTRTGDRAFTDSARERLYALLAYFAPFENEYGLLEGLKSWVFVEWSKSNELVQDVSFASNMLYARLLDTCGQLYGDSDLTGKAAKLRATILDMSMTESGFFCDNALRQDGKLVLSGERTESCQYYAFWICWIVTVAARRCTTISRATLPTWRTRPARCGRTWVTTPPATTGSPRTCCTGWIILDC